MKKRLLLIFSLLLPSCSTKIDPEVLRPFNFADTKLENVSLMGVCESTELYPSIIYEFEDKKNDLKLIFDNLSFYYVPYTKDTGIFDCLLLKKDDDNRFSFSFSRLWQKEFFLKSKEYLKDKNEIVVESKYIVDIHFVNFFEFEDSSLKDKDYTYYAVFNDESVFDIFYNLIDVL